jgi:hypothetical protein
MKRQRRPLFALMLSAAIGSPAAGQPANQQQVPLTYGAWWEQPNLREGYLAATLANRRPCAKAAGRSIAQVADEFWRFGANKPELWSKPVGDVLDAYCGAP